MQANSAMAHNMGLSAEEVAAAAATARFRHQPGLCAVCGPRMSFLKQGRHRARFGAMLARYDPVICRKLILMIGFGFQPAVYFPERVPVRSKQATRSGKTPRPLG
jgi:hypothetical protein